MRILARKKCYLDQPRGLQGPHQKMHVTAKAKGCWCKKKGGGVRPWLLGENGQGFFDTEGEKKKKVV